MTADAWILAAILVVLVVELLLVLAIYGLLRKVERMVNASLHRESMIRAAVSDLARWLGAVENDAPRDPDS